MMRKNEGEVNTFAPAVFVRYLRQLQKMLEKVPEPVWPLSLTEDMLSLEKNAKVAIRFALRGVCPLLKQEEPVIATGAGKEGIEQQLLKTLDYLQTLPKVIILDEAQWVQDTAGFAALDLPSLVYLQQYILPNFFFHLSMVYAIARANGVILGKADFDGFHDYPAGFSLIKHGK